jgi:hypothetical protein
MFENDMMEDYLHSYLKNDVQPETAIDLARNELLNYLNKFFRPYEKSNASYEIPMPDNTLRQEGIEDEMDPHAAEYYSNNIDFINSNQEQKAFFEEIKTYIDNNTSDFFGLDAPAGTGKSFLINLILAYVRKDKDIAIGCAICGIASVILRLGTTFHKRWHPPKNPKEYDTCNIDLDSIEANIIRAAKFIA